MSNLAEIKQRIDNLKEILVGMTEKVTVMAKAVAPELQTRFKKEGTRFGAGAVIGGLGLGVALVGALYLVAALILLLDKAVKELWLSALIVVGALIIGGLFVAIVGAAIAFSSAKKLQKTVDFTGKGAAALAKGAVEEVQKEVTEIQVLAKLEAIKRKRQTIDLLNIAKNLAPLGVGFLLFVLLVWRRKRKKKLALRAPVELVFTED